MTSTINNRIQNISQAIEGRVWLNTVYQSVDPDTGEMVSTSRSILPFRVYQSRNGKLVMDGYDTHRKAVRTFRVDRFKRISRGKQHQGDDPAVMLTRGGEITVYPASWKLVQARPQTVSPKAADKFLSAGWSLTPNGEVLKPA
jgi:predicted DNA-binding transcriptional regulator YafY